MEVKVQCECGTRFAFNVEPVNGRMPVQINCPGCGADSTELANEAIRREFAATAVAVPATPARQPIRVAVPPPQTVLSAAAVSSAAAALTAAATPSPSAAPSDSLAPAPAAPAGAPQTVCCFRHPKIPAKETCRVCGKPICEECMKQFGYVCSLRCRKQGEETGMDIPVYGKQRAVIEARWSRIGAVVWRAAVTLVVVLAGAWIWYMFFGSRPHVIYSEELPRGDRARFYQFLVPGQVLSIKADQMSLFDVARQKPLWSVPLDANVSAPLPSNPFMTTLITNAEEEAGLYFRAGVLATTNDLWIFLPGRLVQYDRHSGNSKQEIPLKPPYFGLATNENGFTIISSDESSRPIITRIKFADGSVQTEPVESAKVSLSDRESKPSSVALSTNNPNYTKLAKIANMVKLASLALGKADNPEERTNWDDTFVADGDGVVQVKVDLLEHKTVMRQAMRTPQKKAEVDGNLTAGQSMEAAEQMMNEARRAQTGGEEKEDVSRFQVTLHRLPAGTAPDWTGGTIGEPSFYALQTLNVLVSGRTLQVFDKNNRKLWEASLIYSIPPRRNPPCVEAGNTLYVFDQSTLTSFEAATGDVHWRLTSVGISEVQPDGRGNFYVTSTTASPDTIRFSQQVDLSSKGGPVILKVDGATGKVLWRTEGIGNQCFVSGKYVYIAKAAQNPLISPGEDPVLYFDLFRLNPSDGYPMWDYSQSRHPVQIEVQGNEILIHFKGELQVLKFFSL